MHSCVVLNTYTNYMQLKKLGFNLDKVLHLSSVYAFLCHLDSKTVLGVDDLYTNPHHPMVSIDHVAPLLLLQSAEARVAYLEEAIKAELID